MNQPSLRRLENVNFIRCDAPIFSMKEQLQLIGWIPKDTRLLWVPHYNIPLLYRGKLLVTVHDVCQVALPVQFSGIHKRLWAKTMFASVRAKTDEVLCVSEFTKSELVRLVGIGEDRIHVVVNGIDESWFRVKREKSPHPKRYLLYVGNVKPHKNLKTLLEAFVSIRDGIPHDLLIVGKAEGLMTRDDSFLLRTAKFQDRVLVKGWVELEELKQYMVNADALILPSLYEGFGFPPLEAMACGLPVIATPVGSVKEYVEDDVNGFLFPRKDVDALAEKLNALLKNQKVREIIGAEARKTILQRSSWEKSAQKILFALHELVK